ncbi:MAG: polysaccharide biosynthesis tyrosine autokinase [Bacteroidales bacterium]|nr:polysaccharide biosynthesis tyrosine autokinase [Bacteroidales bacterium]
MNQSRTSPNQTPPGYTPSNYGYPTPLFLEEDKPINWRKYLFLFLRNWYWFLIVLGIALGIAFFKIRYSIPRYQATATLIIQDEENAQDVLSEFRAVRYWRRQADMANETAKLSSFTTINRAVDSLNQDIFWTGYGRIRIRPIYINPRFQLIILSDSVDWYRDLEWFIDYINSSEYRFYREDYIDTILPFNKVINLFDWQFIVTAIPNGLGHDTYSFVVNDPTTLTKKYRQKLVIETDEREGTVITLQSTGPVGEREVDFLNILSKTYIISELERKRKIAENTFEFIDDQIDVILDSLHQAEDQLLTYRLSNNVINLSREGEIAYERLKSFQEQRTQLELKENYYAYLKKYLNERNDPQTIIAPTILDANDQILIATVTELQGLYEERENLDISVMDNNPGLENINERIKAVRLRILEIINGLIENNSLTLKQLGTEEDAIINQLKTLPISEQQLLNITRRYDLYNEFYTYLLQKRAESGIQKASAVSNARILDPARYDQLIPVGNNRMIILFIALALGIFIPAGILILRDALDNKIRERDDIVNKTDIPIIGTIGHAVDVGLLPAKIDPKSSFTETLRRIRTNLSFALKEKDQKVVMVTSSISGEGKTFTAANLATIIAMNNQKVLLVGADLRKPTLHRIFNVSNEIGITSYIIGEKEIQDIIFQTDIDNLFLIPAGPVPPNPAELLETKRMKILFDKARREFDYIITDTPPIALVADALSVAIYADLTLYLVRQNHSHKGVLEIANSMKNEEKLPNIYLLINDIRPSRSMGLYYYYGYGKGYNYGYYDYNYSTEE